MIDPESALRDELGGLILAAGRYDDLILNVIRQLVGLDDSDESSVEDAIRGITGKRANLRDYGGREKALIDIAQAWDLSAVQFSGVMPLMGLRKMALNVRNRAVHDPWVTDPATGELRTAPTDARHGYITLAQVQTARSVLESGLSGAELLTKLALESRPPR